MSGSLEPDHFAMAGLRITDFSEDFAVSLRVECVRFIAALVCGGAALAELRAPCLSDTTNLTPNARVAPRHTKAAINRAHSITLALSAMLHTSAILVLLARLRRYPSVPFCGQSSLIAALPHRSSAF